MRALRRALAVVVALGAAPFWAVAGNGAGPTFVNPEIATPPGPAGQPDKPPAAIPADLCKDASVQVDEGIVTVDLTNSVLAGRKVAYRLGPFATTTASDSAGHVRLLAPLFSDAGVMEWSVAGAAPCTRDVAFANYRSAFVFAISWVEPAGAALDLDLHAIEPGSAIGAASGYVSRTHTTGDASTQGVFRSFGNRGPGEMRIQYYSVPSFRPVRHGIYTFRVEFTSRQNPPVPPFCQGYPQERASFHVYQLLHGELGERNSAFGSRECGRGFANPTLGFARFEMQP